MAGWTNRGKYRALGIVFRGVTPPTSFYFALCTSATAPTADTNLLSDLTEIAAGNGYTAGGQAVARDATDFDVYTEDDSNDVAYIQIKDLTWTASGGNLPASGNGARWGVMVDDNVTVANREVWARFDLGADRVVTSGQNLTLQSAELRLSE